MLRRSDTKQIAQSNQVGYSNPLSLWANSEELLELMTYAFKKEMYYQVNHMGHMSLELAMKAVYAKYNSNEHPFGHDLGIIPLYEYESDKCLFEDIKKTSSIYTHYLTLRTAWVMQDRYQRRRLNHEDSLPYKIAYLEVTRWIYSKHR